MVYAVTEGEEKPLKYPVMFRACDVVVVNKIDLLPHLDFDLDRFVDQRPRRQPDRAAASSSAPAPARVSTTGATGCSSSEERTLTPDRRREYEGRRTWSRPVPEPCNGVDGEVAMEQLVIGSGDDPERADAVRPRAAPALRVPGGAAPPSEEPSYGYELVKGLRAFRFGDVDRPAVYRALAQLEKDGLVRVAVGAVEGGHGAAGLRPHRRRRAALRRWMGVVKEERDALDRVLRRYRATARPQALLADADVATGALGGASTWWRVSTSRRQRADRARGSSPAGSARRVDIARAHRRVRRGPAVHVPRWYRTLRGAHRGALDRRADHLRRARHHRLDRVLAVGDG